MINKNITSMQYRPLTREVVQLKIAYTSLHNIVTVYLLPLVVFSSVLKAFINSLVE